MIEDMLKFKFVVVKEKFLNNIMTKFIVKDLIEVSLAILEHIAPNVVVNGCQFHDFLQHYYSMLVTSNLHKGTKNFINKLVIYLNLN